MLRHVMAGLAVVGILAAMAAGATQVLVLKDGRTFKGEVTKTPEGYRIDTRMAVLTFTNDQVEKVIEQVNPIDEYNQRAAKIDAKDARAHLQLGQWAQQKGLLDAARDEYQKAIEIDPNIEMAKALLAHVNEKLNAPVAGGQGGVSVAPPEAGLPSEVPQNWLVTQEGIYKIRMGEFSPKRDSLPVRFRNNVLEKFIKAMRGRNDIRGAAFDENRFNALSSGDKAKYIVENTEWNDPLRNDVLLLGDPQPLKEFRGRIWAGIATQCATVQCHGGPRGQGNFRLLGTPARNDRVDYTNFLILSSTRHGQWSLIDRQQREDSLLLTYLQRKEAVRPTQVHPGRELTPLYLDVKAAAYRQMLDWISSLKGPPEGGQYGVTVTLPAGKAAPPADPALRGAPATE
ncbi:MAG: hypothetical protein LLG01_18200 [Planctomycetaceae bacterium]|nr:hypothetical protein [Planctomycetaceae bacterium]